MKNRIFILLLFLVFFTTYIGVGLTCKGFKIVVKKPEKPYYLRVH